VRTRRTTRRMQALLWEKAPLWSMIESTPLLDATNNVPPWCSLLDDAIGLLSAMNSNPNRDFLFWNNSNNWEYNCNNSDIMQNNSTKTEQFWRFIRQWQLPWCSLSFLWQTE
jgi:hypothetical protein